MVKRLKVSEDTSVAMPLRNLVAVLMAVGIGAFAFFDIMEQVHQLQTNFKLINPEIEKNSNFRILWPAGKMGSLPADSEQFMLIQHLSTKIEDIEIQLDRSAYNSVNIKRLQDDVVEARANIEGLKDAVRNVTITP